MTDWQTAIDWQRLPEFPTDADKTQPPFDGKYVLVWAEGMEQPTVARWGDRSPWDGEEAEGWLPIWVDGAYTHWTTCPVLPDEGTTETSGQSAAPIPRATLDAAHRRLTRRVAALLIQAMAEHDMGYDELAEALGVKPIAMRNYINGLITGKTKAMRDVSDLACALDCEFHFTVHPIERPE